MKKALILILAAFFVLGMTAVAYAADPVEDTPYTFTETEPGRTANPPDQGAVPADTIQPPGPTPFGSKSGASAWAYKDSADTVKMYGTATKFEGSYEPFQDAANNLYDYDSTGRDRGPHGGYATTTQKCKVCHAVHRANGAYMLLRVDNANDACSYCHVGDHRHSVVSAYWQAGTIFPSNGHTIGAGKDIPDSSTWQWQEEETFTNINNQTGHEESQTIHVRRYLESRIKLFRINNGNRRVGPTFLRCMSCHQVHNASELIWKPYDSAGVPMTDGYKLLRKDPSGLIKVNPPDINPDGTINEASLDVRTRSRLDNTSLLPGHGAPSATPINAIDTDYTGEGIIAGAMDPTFLELEMGSPNTTGYTTVKNPGIASGRVQEVSLSVWCGNCHNLNVAGKEEVESNWGGSLNGTDMLSDRSHPAPMAWHDESDELGSQCYSCHNNDMPRVGSSGTYTVQGMPLTFTTGHGGNAGCWAPCHIAPAVYRSYKQTYRTYLGVAGGNSLSDFPHSGSANGFKLLNDVNPLGTVSSSFPAGIFTPFRPGSGDGLDKICGGCHMRNSHYAGIGIRR